MKKTLEENRYRGLFLNLTKTIYDKPTGNVILNGEKVKAFPLKLGKSQRCPLSPLLFSVVLETVARRIKQEETQRICKEINQVIICRWNDSLHRRPKKFYQRLLEVIPKFCSAKGYKTTIQKAAASQITSRWPKGRLTCWFSVWPTAAAGSQEGQGDSLVLFPLHSAAAGSPCSILIFKQTLVFYKI